jgi:hypothetical protein
MKEKEISTIFSDPKKKEAGSKKPKGKIIAVILTALIVLFVAVPWLIVEIANGSDERYVAPFSSRVENTKADELGITLFNLKNKKISDIEANERIISALPIKNDLGEFTVTYKTDKKPYRLTMEIKNPHDTSLNDWYGNTLVKYSCVLLALIGDADEIAWSYPDQTGKTVSGYVTRKDAETFLKVPVKNYAKSEKSVQLLLNELGIE